MQYRAGTGRNAVLCDSLHEIRGAEPEMNRRQLVAFWAAAFAARFGFADSLEQPQGSGAHSPNRGGDLPDRLLLRNWRPRSIYTIPVTEVTKARYPVIDVHNHGVDRAEQTREIVKSVDATGDCVGYQGSAGIRSGIPQATCSLYRDKRPHRSARPRRPNVCRCIAVAWTTTENFSAPCMSESLAPLSRQVQRGHQNFSA
jgi:hypothetical protein